MPDAQRQKICYGEVSNSGGNTAERYLVDSLRIEQFVGGIYDAAVDGRLWDEALFKLTDLTGCRLATIEIYDADKDGVRGNNPLMDPDYRASYHRYWRPHFSLRKRTLSFPEGRVIPPDQIIDFEAETKTAFYNEWVRPQGLCVSALFANIFVSGGTAAILSAWKPSKLPEFSDEEERLFEIAVGHFVRAITIHRRLRLAEAQQSAPMAGAAPAGFLIVDRNGYILAAHEPTRQQLCAAGLIASRGEQGSVRLDDPALRKLVAGATADSATGTLRAGRIEHRGGDGTLLSMTMIPLADGVGRPDAPWLPISEPAALLCITAPEDGARERVRQLADAYGLTPGEAAVALEAAKGDGRAAVAARLGIRETTVRSHLSAIFDKVGLHRQAELTRIVSGGAPI